MYMEWTYKWMKDGYLMLLTLLLRDLVAPSGDALTNGYSWVEYFPRDIETEWIGEAQGWQISLLWPTNFNQSIGVPWNTV